MTDDYPTEPVPQPDSSTEPAAETPSGDSRNAAEAWATVVSRMGELGDAVSDWARAAADNPENRRRLDDVRRGVNDIAGRADETFARVTGGEIGQHVKASAVEAGAAIGAAAGAAGRAAAPVVATTFAGIAEFFGTAAERMEEAATRGSRESAAAPEPTVPTGEPAEPVPPAGDAPEPPPAPPIPPEVGE